MDKPIRGHVLLESVFEAVHQDADARQGPADKEGIAALFAKLTPREFEVFDLLARGDSLKQIARKLHRNRKTIEPHTAKVTSKSEVSNRIGLLRSGIRDGLILI